jgi:hypothetical protein
MAPAFRARTRTLSSGKAVIKINGATYPLSRIWVRRSKPLMAGICTSAMTHDESLRRGDCKNSSADANVSTRYPCELRRLFVATRTDTSSSMIEITERIDKTAHPEVRARRLPLVSPPNKCAINRNCKAILRFVRARVYFRVFRPFSPDRLTTSLPFSS